MKDQFESIVYKHGRIGLEYDWLALDADGCLGIFSTAGAGPIPSSIMTGENKDVMVFEILMTLPIVTRPLLPKICEHNISDWTALAERGIFAFDWRRDCNDYCLIAYPAEPLQQPTIVLAKYIDVLRPHIATFKMRFSGMMQE